MKPLTQRQTEKVFRGALTWARIVDSQRMPLHQVISAYIGKPIIWRQDPHWTGEGYGMVGAAKWDGGEILYIKTPSEKEKPVHVRWAYAYEVAHIILLHYRYYENLLRFTPIFGKEEAQAHSFALAYYGRFKNGQAAAIVEERNRLYDVLCEINMYSATFDYSYDEFDHDLEVIDRMWDGR
ncbi:MAG: hypothetical protein ACOCXY_00790 [Planctomycetota bacterium]